MRVPRRAFIALLAALGGCQLTVDVPMEPVGENGANGEATITETVPALSPGPLRCSSSVAGLRFGFEGPGLDQNGVSQLHTGTCAELGAAVATCANGDFIEGFGGTIGALKEAGPFAVAASAVEFDEEGNALSEEPVSCGDVVFD